MSENDSRYTIVLDKINIHILHSIFAELCFLKCEFEHNDLVDRGVVLSLLIADHTLVGEARTKAGNDPTSMGLKNKFFSVHY